MTYLDLAPAITALRARPEEFEFVNDTLHHPRSRHRFRFDSEGDVQIDALRGTRIWCLAGPDGAKDELVSYLDRYKDRDGHIAALRDQLVSISSMDRPTDDGVLVQARQTLGPSAAAP